MPTLNKRSNDDVPVDSEEDESQMDSPISQACLAAKKLRCEDLAYSMHHSMTRGFSSKNQGKSSDLNRFYE